MHVNHCGKDLVIGFDSQEEAAALYAVLTNTPQTVSPEALARGQWMYAWFFNQVQRMAQSFDQESSLKTQSPETMEGPQQSSKKTRKR